MIYQEALNYINSFVDYEKFSSYPYEDSFKLDRIERLLELLGKPHKPLKVIHVAGSKGKGSTCAMAASILAEAGYKVGFYTSPHLISIRERIKIIKKPETRVQKPESRFKHFNKQNITKKEFCKLIEQIRPAVEKLEKEYRKKRPLTFFEILTALAFLYFKKTNTDFCVVEVGLGGRLDATNVIEPLVCAITNISLEHTDKLGDTLAEIASEKAGIIKRSVPLVSAPQEEKVLKVLRKFCMEKDAEFEVVKPGSLFKRYPGLKLNLLGRHQIENAAVAAGAIEKLRNYGISIDKKTISKGLASAYWPGRLEIIGKSPYVIVDGAQNRESARRLKDALTQLFKFRELFLILGISKDKDIPGICSELIPISDTVILTKADNPRAAQPEVIKRNIKGSKNIFITEDTNSALRMAKQKAKKEDLILVTGSLYLVGEAIRLAPANL